ncbi:MAG: hypothetical protein WD341_06085 [Tistlia sp.]|uniref:head-tail joining protein n=1 Tax=Tistlia sp. TaxID=3057121 RepID=UPI0034A34CBC
MASWDERSARVAASVAKVFRRSAAATYSHAGAAATALPNGVKLHNPRLSGEAGGRGLAGEFGGGLEQDLPRAEIPVADLAAIAVASPARGDLLSVAGDSFAVRAVERNADETVWILGLAPQG